METLDCIRTRTSVREFSREDIPDHFLKELLEAATQAPSAGNTQEWVFIAVREEEQKKHIAEAAFGQEFILHAPVVVVVCADLERIQVAYGERGVSLYAYQDTAAAIQTMLLAAWEKGIGSCWVGAFNETRLKGALVIPTNIKPVAIIPLGYPADKPAKPERRPLQEIIFKETWGGKWEN